MRKQTIINAMLLMILFSCISLSTNAQIRKSIELTEFKTAKPVYAPGERLEFLYDYVNEDGLRIKTQKWRYRYLSGSKAKVAAKPKTFKKSGKYEVTLQLQDELGRWTKTKSCIVTVADKKQDITWKMLFDTGKVGQVISSYGRVDYNKYQNAFVTLVEDTPGTLFLSNSPEKVNGEGLLYQDVVSGVGRIALHHQNNGITNHKLVVFAENKEHVPVTLSIWNEAIKGPHLDILTTGQDALYTYLKTTPKKEYVLKPGQRVLLYNSENNNSWTRNEVVSGTMDFQSTGKVALTVASASIGKGLNQINNLTPLPKDVHIRGTFSSIERHYTVNLEKMLQPTKLLIGKQEEEWQVGVDAIGGKKVENAGNYGLTTFIHLQSSEEIGAILNVRSGLFKGAIKWNNTIPYRMPKNQNLTDKHTIVLLGTTKSKQKHTITYMLPNGSAAPVLFGFIPKSIWNEAAY